MRFNAFVHSRDPAKMREHRLRLQGYDDGYARRPARSSLLVYQRSYRLGTVARDAADEGRQTGSDQ